MEYTVILSDDILSRVSELLLDAGHFGQGVEAASAYSTILLRLRTEAFTYGEVLYHVATGRGVYHKTVRPLSVWYAIYEEHRVVWIVRVDRMSSTRE